AAASTINRVCRRANWESGWLKVASHYGKRKNRPSMHILNLGAGGFIGSHLTQKLLSEGHSVTAVDLWPEKVQALLSNPRLKFIQQDIREAGWNLDPLVQEADLVIDLIAYANPGL